MKITKTTDAQVKPSTVMLCYGNGGVGKTTFAATAPKPLLVDCENGAKYFGLRGIEMDVARVNEWSDLQGIFEVAKSGEYETIIIDPIGELMEKLKTFMINKGEKKNVMPDGSPTIAGWGWLKDTMRSTLKIIRDSGVNLLINAHVEEKDVDGTMMKRPKIMTKLSEELIAFVDVVGYMEVITVQGEIKRVIRVQPSDRYEAKDRTNQLGQVVPPNFKDIVDACQGTKTFKWSKQKEVAAEADAGESGIEQNAETATDTPSKKTAVSAKLKKATKKK